MCEGRLILVCPKARQPERKASMASAAVRALAKVRTPRVTLEQLTGEAILAFLSGCLAFGQTWVRRPSHKTSLAPFLYGLDCKNALDKNSTS